MEGGYRGIVVVFSAFMIQFLAFGNYSIIGIYTVHLLHVFENDAVGVSLISAIHSALLLCSGPLASFLMTKITFRKLSIAGAALVSLGIFCTPLLVYLPTMYLFFGVFAGLGGCLIYLPSHVLSGLYYDKYRSISTGVATAGQGMGATVMPLIVGMLIEEYTWRGSLMLLAAVDMHLFIFALLMVEPPEESEKPLHQDAVYPDHKDTVVECFALEPAAAKSPIVNSTSQYQKAEPHSPERVEKTENHQQQTPNHVVKIDNQPQSTNHLVKTENQPQSTNHLVKTENQQLSEERSVTSVGESSRELTYSTSLKRRGSRCRRLERRPSRSSRPRSVSLTSVPEDDISRIFIPSYLAWLPNFRNSFDLYDSNDTFETAIVESEESPFDEKEEEQQETQCTDVEKVSLVNGSQNYPVEISLKEHFKDHLRVLAEFKFMVYFVSTIIWSMTTTMFVTFGPDLIVMQGHKAVDAAFVFTFYGVGQLIGCVFISITGNVLGRRIVLYMVANVLTGVFIGIVPLFKSFTELAVVLVCMGFAVGCILGLYMIVSVDILGTKDMEIGLGYVLLASGMGCFAGPPLGGYLSSVYGDYDKSFYMAGGFTVFAGLIMVIIYIPKCRTHKNLAVHQVPTAAHL